MAEWNDDPVIKMSSIILDRRRAMCHGEGLVAATLAICTVAAVAAAVPGQNADGALLSSEPAAWLAAQGYPADDYDLLLSWQERSGRADERMTWGFRLSPRDGSAAFDLYADASGEILDIWEQTARGIWPKRWTQCARQQAPEVHPGFPKQALAERPVPVTAAARIPLNELALPFIDLERVWLEDASGLSSPSKGVERVGVLRDIPEPIQVRGAYASDGSWRELRDGTRVWALSIRSLGALGQRAHFARMRLPQGARVIVYNTDEPAEAYGPLEPQNDLWSPTCFGEAVAVECTAPPGAALEDVDIAIDRIAHNYKDIASLTSPGACNLDVPCYPGWLSTAMGVGGVGTIGNEAVLWCTGALLADGVPDAETPFFLTAYHCVGGAATANTIEVYWLYRSQTCVATPEVPDPATVPRTTGGATFLAGSPVETGTDFSLLQLRELPPLGIPYLGFATDPVAIGAEVVCIHHPRGDYQRISFATLTDDGSPAGGGLPMQPAQRFHEALWHDGTTEPGSSGSPLFLNGMQLIIGQLWGGRASCNLPNEPDYFGRFDITYPLVERWLGPAVNPYDVDGSGDVTAADVQLVINAALGRTTLDSADVDASGQVDAADVQRTVIALLNTL